VAGHFLLPLKERRVTLDLQLRAAHSTVNGDKVHLMNALTNLVDNALKYGPEGATIRIRSRVEGKQLMIAVEDQGIGIRREDLKHIFERFYRVHTGNVHDVKGFGLGLHYVQQIAVAHGGKVRVESEPDHGSTFTLALPLDTLHA
jgi:two-component system phosphate regulon sensor histidine kinase PhoR